MRIALFCDRCLEKDEKGNCMTFSNGKPKNIISIKDAVEKGFNCVIFNQNECVCGYCEKGNSDGKTCELYPAGIPYEFLDTLFHDEFVNQFESFKCFGIREQFTYCRSCDHYYFGRQSLCEMYPNGIPDHFLIAQRYDYPCPCKYYIHQRPNNHTTRCDSCKKRKDAPKSCSVYPASIPDEYFHTCFKEEIQPPCHHFMEDEKNAYKQGRYICIVCKNYIKEACMVYPYGIPINIHMVNHPEPSLCEYFENAYDE